MNSMIENAQFSWFWKNYKCGTEWIKKHEVAYWKSLALALKAENEELLEMVHSLQHGLSANAATASPCVPYKMRLNKRHRQRIKQQERREERERSHANQATQSDLDVEVSPELLEFMKVSLKHKKEYQKEKELREASLQEFQPPQESADLRQKEMDELYGDGCAKILGMETAIALAYDRFMDQKDPKYWPDLPLSL